MPDDPFVSYLLGFNYFAQTGDPAELRKPLNVIAQLGPEAARSVAFPTLGIPLVFNSFAKPATWLIKKPLNVIAELGQEAARGVAFLMPRVRSRIQRDKRS